MLEITIPELELFDEKTLRFSHTPSATLKLEHSLLSISKWESKYKRPFLKKTDVKTPAEMLDYIKMMTITPNVDPEVYRGLTPELVKQISDYIDDPMTATTFTDNGPKGKNSGRVLTNEVIYCWMANYGIPFSCEKWHIARLLTLIRACSLENQPPKKMDTNTILKQNAALNKARRAKLGSKG